MTPRDIENLRALKSGLEEVGRKLDAIKARTAPAKPAPEAPNVQGSFNTRPNGRD